MANSDKYCDAFRHLLTLVEERLAEAKERLANERQRIKKQRSGKGNKPRLLRHELSKLELDRWIRDPSESMRDIEVLLADPTAASKLFIPDISEAVLAPIEKDAGELLWAAFKDGLVTEPIFLSSHLKGLSADKVEPVANWRATIRCLRMASPNSFDAADGDWSRIVEARIVIEMIIGIIEPAKPDDSSARSPHAPHDLHAPYMPARWFSSIFEIKYERLRSAMRDGRIRAIRPNSSKKSYLYSVPDAQRIWPDEEIWNPETPAETGADR